MGKTAQSDLCCFDGARPAPGGPETAPGAGDELAAERGGRGRSLGAGSFRPDLRGRHGSVHSGLGPDAGRGSHLRTGGGHAQRVRWFHCRCGPDLSDCRPAGPGPGGSEDPTKRQISCHRQGHRRARMEDCGPASPFALPPLQPAELSVRPDLARLGPLPRSGTPGSLESIRPVRPEWILPG